jgi:hypothetical protein
LVAATESADFDTITKSPEFRRLVDMISRERCVLYVGAGLSAYAYTTPTWDKMVTSIADRLGHLDLYGETTVKAHKLEYLEHCRKEETVDFERVLKGVLEQVNQPVSQIHKSLVEIPWAAVITTNYDTALEKAYDSAGKKCVVIDDESDIHLVAYERGTQIVKMHGSLDSYDRVLTASEYQRFDLESHAMKSLVVSLLAQFPVLFLGAGLSDPSFTKLYSIVRTSLKDFKHSSYYVSPKLPLFVEEFWNDRGLKTFTVPHDHLGEFVATLSRAVEQAIDRVPANKGRQISSQFCKTSALTELAGEQHRKPHFSYLSLQERYLSLIHVPDFDAFSSAWESTLYEPLRENVLNTIDREGQNMKLAYIGPGPHAPLFNDAGMNKRIIDNVSSIHLMDISDQVLRVAEEHVRRHIDRPITAETADVTCGEGDHLCRLLSELVALKSMDDIRVALDDVLSRPLPRHSLKPSRKADLGEPFDFAYSEMVASFTGTPALMAAETRIRRKFRNPDAEAMSAVLTRLRLLWQRFNELSYKVQLDFMASILRPGGLMVLAFDTEKVFSDSFHSTVFTFTSSDAPQPDDGAHLKADPKYVYEEIWWNDHPFSFSGEFSGPSADYFLKHKHRVKLIAYRRL